MKGALLIPRNKYPEETRQKILDVARHLFVTKGYEKTTILDIVAGMSGMTRGAFYHHFKSKDEVFIAIMDKHHAGQNPFSHAQAQTHLNGLEKIKLILKTQLAQVVNNGEDAELIGMALSLLDNPRMLADHVKSNREVAVPLSAIIQEGMDDGSIRPGNALVLAELLMLTINHWFFPSIYPFDPDTADAKGMVVRDIFEHLGMPLFDEEMMGLFEGFAQALDW